MRTGRSFAEYVKDKCYNGLYEAAERYVSESYDELQLWTKHVKRIGSVEFSDAAIHRVYVSDMPGMKVAFDVGMELELIVRGRV